MISLPRLVMGWLPAIVICCGATGASAQPHPAGDYSVALVKNPIVIDGTISNGSEWSEAMFRSGQWREAFGPSAGQVSGFTNGFRLLWDDNPSSGGLYLWGQLNHQAPPITSSGAVVFDGSLDLLGLYLDPNLNFEDTFQNTDTPDGYQFSVNVTGPNNGVTGQQQYANGGQVDTGNIRVAAEAHVNALEGNQGGMSHSGNPVDLSDTSFRFAARGMSTGWNVEMFMPWTLFDACTGGPNGNGDGLCVTLDTFFGAPAMGDEWYFNLGTLFQASGQLHAPGYASFPGDAGLGDFAAGPHPTITFVESIPFDPSPDLNQDGNVDAADAAIMFEDWGGPGRGDLNNDNLIDAADAGILFESWTGDAVPSAVPEPLGGSWLGLGGWWWLVEAGKRQRRALTARTPRREPYQP